MTLVPLFIFLVLPSFWWATILKVLCAIFVLGTLRGAYNFGLLGGIFFSGLFFVLLNLSSTRLMSYVFGILLVVSIAALFRAREGLDIPLE
jgi:hypothetical protein